MHTSTHTIKRAIGFSMLEMMVVVAFIGILAVMALPSYLARITRQQIESAIPLADIAKKPIAASWATTQTLPADNTATGLPAANKIVNNFISGLSVQDGVITVTFGNHASGSISGKILTLRPALMDDAPVVPITWVCGKAAAPNGMSVKGVNQTNVPDTYLPLECR